MYLVKIINDKEEVIINHTTVNRGTNKIQGNIKQGINCIDSFTFTIYPQNDGYGLIYPFKTLVTVYNTKTNKYEFRGRVLTLSSNMDDSGVVSKTCICESELGYLCDTVQVYKELHGISPKGYLQLLLDNHNENIEEEKKLYLGVVTVTDPNDSLYKYVAYDTTWKNINDDLIDTLGGELQIRYEGNKKYLDYLTEKGKVCTTEIRLGRNIADITEEIDATNFYTRLVPLGAKFKTTDEEGNGTETEERLTISEVNGGRNYIDDEEGIKQFGIIQGIVMWDSVTIADNLLRKGKAYLAAQRISISNEVSALDLSLIGLEVDSFEVGNYYPLKHELLNIDCLIRIIEKNISIEEPYASTITLGDKSQDIKQYQLKNMRNTKEIQSLTKISNDIQDNLNSANTSITELNGSTESMGNEINSMKLRSYMEV